MTREAPESSAQFSLTSRLLHWLMVPMVVVQLFIAAVMMASLVYRPLLLAIHQPLGIAILVVVVIRLVNRILHRVPPLPSTMRPLERYAAKGSEYLLYALLVVLPLVGWSVLSAAGTPIFLAGLLRLPPIAPEDAALFGTLRTVHSVLGYLLFATFTAHMCATLMHTLALRDGLMDRMALWSTRKDRTGRPTPATVDQQVL